MSGPDPFTALSGYRLMWMMVFFDLPVDDLPRRKAATDFRNFLLDLGFLRSQFSVYVKYLTSKEKAAVLTRQISKGVPEYGDVKILCFTDKQYENIVSFQGQARQSPLKNPSQLALF